MSRWSFRMPTSHPSWPHRTGSFDWATGACRSGLPGILNADDRGLGKTLRSIAFLSWLQSHMGNADAAERGPITIVAPTSLLRTWEAEVGRQVAQGRFGRPVRLCGSSLAGHVMAGGPGAALKMLHHIRSVSAHPALHEVDAPPDFVAMSVRRSAVMVVLARIYDARERALVCIEHREMQFSSAALLRRCFGLDGVMSSTGPRRSPGVRRSSSGSGGIRRRMRRCSTCLCRVRRRRAPARPRLRPRT